MRIMYKQKEVKPVFKNGQLFLQYLKPNIIGSDSVIYHCDLNPNELSYDINTVPQLTHYFYHGKQKVSSSETIIPIYFSDYYQREYYYNDDSLKFNIRLELDGEVSYIHGVSAGDYDLSLGILDVGEHEYNIEIIQTDNGLRSHRLFNKIWIVDDSNDITEAQTHQITEVEMNRYNVTLGLDETATATQMNNNRHGVTSLLSDLHNQGYRKVIFPANSVIRVNATEEDGSDIYEGAIVIPTDMTVDLNNSTIKLHPYDDREYGNRGEVYNYMVVFSDCIDSHMINGTLEGDYFERQTMVWETTTDENGNEVVSNALGGDNGEHSHCITMNGGKYNTLDNITIKQVTGYNLQCEMSYSRGIHPPSSGGIVVTYGGADNPGSWTYLNTDIIDGVEVPTTGRLTCEYLDLTNLLKNDTYFTTGPYLGSAPFGYYYHVKCTFYDENKNYLTDYIAYQNRYSKIPDGAVYMRCTISADSCEDVSSKHFFVYASCYSEYNEWNNLIFIDDATCCNPNRFKHLRLYNCKFYRCGEYITPLVIDAEDGSSTMQDLFTEYCSIEEAGAGDDYVSVAGYNVVFQNNTNMNWGIRGEVVGATIRNNTSRDNTKSASNEISTSWRAGNTIRVYNNDYKYKPFHFGRSGTSQLKIKNCNYMKMFSGWTNDSSKGWLVLEDCHHLSLGCNTCYNNCTFYLDYMDSEYCDGNNCTNKCRFKNCTFTCDSTNTTTYNIKPFNYGSNIDDIGEWINCAFNVGNSSIEFSNFQVANDFLRGYFYGCTFDSNIILTLEYANEMGDIQFNNCTFNRNLTIDLIETKVQFNNCTFNGDIIYRNNGQANSSFTPSETPPEPVVYTITNNLINVTTNNMSSEINEGDSYTATLSPSSGYMIDSITVSMNGVNITSDVYNNGTINITSVTGNIVIICIATINSSINDTLSFSYQFSNTTPGYAAGTVTLNSTETVSSATEYDLFNI